MIMPGLAALVLAKVLGWPEGVGTFCGGVLVDPFSSKGIDTDRPGVIWNDDLRFTLASSEPRANPANPGGVHMRVQCV